MDVIAKAKSLAYQSDPEVDEAMKSEALTDELKGAIIELKMVPKIENKSKMPEWKDQPRTERSDLLRRSRSNSSQNMHDTYKKRNSGRTFLYANDDSDTSSSVIPGYGTGFDEDTEIETINQNSWSQRVPVSGGNTENTHIRLSQQSVYSLKEAEKDNGIVVYKPAEPQPERCLSPDTVTENILEGLDDSEVYDGNVTLNRIFSLRRDIVQYRHKDPKRKRSSTTEYTSVPQSQRNSEIVQENVMQETSVPVLQSEVITTEVDICRENQGKTRTKTDPQHEVQSDEDIFGDTCVSSSINVSLEDVLGDVSDSEMDIMTSEALVKRGAQPSVFANKTVERYSPEETFEHVVEDVIGETSDFESDNDLLNEKKTAHLSYDYITRNETSLTSSCEAMVDDNPRSVSSYQTRPSCSEASQDEESDASMSWQAQQGNLFEEYITHTEGLTDSIHSQYTGRPKSELVNEEVSQSNGTYYITETVRTTSTTSSVFTTSQRMSCTEEEEVVKVPLDNERVVITLEPIKICMWLLLLLAFLHSEVNSVFVSDPESCISVHTELRPPPEVGEQELPSTAKEEHQQEIPRHSDGNSICACSQPHTYTFKDDLKPESRPTSEINRANVIQPLEAVASATLRDRLADELDLLLFDLVQTLVRFSDSCLEDIVSSSPVPAHGIGAPTVSVISSHSPDQQAIWENTTNEAIDLIREANLEQEEDNSRLLLTREPSPPHPAPSFLDSDSSSSEEGHSDMDYEDDMDFALGDLKIVYPREQSTKTTVTHQTLSPVRHHQEYTLPPPIRECNLRSLQSSSESHLHNLSSPSLMHSRSVSSHVPLSSGYTRSYTRSSQRPAQVKMQKITCFGIDIQIPMTAQGGTGEDHEEIQTVKLKKSMPKMRDIIVHEDPDSVLQAVSLSGRLDRQVKEFMLERRPGMENIIKDKLKQLLELVDQISHEFRKRETEDSDQDLIAYYIQEMCKQLWSAVTNSIVRKVSRQANDSISMDTLKAIVAMVMDSLMNSFDKAMGSIRERSEYLNQIGLEVPTLQEVLFYDTEPEKTICSDSHDCKDHLLHGGTCPHEKTKARNAGDVTKKSSPDALENMLFGRPKRKKRERKSAQRADVILSTMGGNPGNMDTMLYGGRHQCLLDVLASRLACDVVQSALAALKAQSYKGIAIESLKDEVRDLVRSGFEVLGEESLSVCSDDFVVGDCSQEESFTDTTEEAILVVSLQS
ncbi:hypothetical protein CAPTEDRAFT_210858 [Capitella teleta]|uniref:Uncharacterized protein n=1 Tax=Capitella teleta TaxID=283909 RepID=R7U1Y9_CAPTE|nr:hypothetical protein CAPTEDRAFT_210858 [Capitella teleta]|eukprot:ELT99872.1 hypothetical protein CAPTEDRAFT_210858 [Capitella teleta]